METRRIVGDVRRLLVESEMKEGKYDNSEDEKNKKEKEMALIEIYQLTGDFLKESKTSKKDKPTITGIEKIATSFSLSMQEHRSGANAPSTSWIDIEPRMPWNRKKEVLENKNVNISTKQNIDIVSDIQNERRRNTREEYKERELRRLKYIMQRNSKSTAITIQCEGDATYNEVILKAKKKIKLTEYNIDDCKIRKGYTGGLVIEIPGEGAVHKADKLADGLRKALEEDCVRVQRPRKKIDVKILGLEETTSKEEITDVVTSVGEGMMEDIRVSEIRRTARGMGIAWVQCPVEAAIKIIEKEKIRIGWTMVRCERTAPRPMRCYRCMETGHSRHNCRSSIDRSGNCYNCGETGHTAINCKNRVSCMTCK